MYIMEDSVISRLPRSIQEQCLLEKEIIEGRFGEPGSPFVSTRELADMRGVSLVTAQRVLVGLREKGLVELNGKKYVLSHQPHVLKKEKFNKIIGLHLTNIANPFFCALADAVERSAAKKGYTVLIVGSSYKLEREKNAMDIFDNIKVAGVLSCPGINENSISIYTDYNIPHIFLGRESNIGNGQSVLVNNYPAARKVAEHFTSMGYKSFAYVGPKELIDTDDMRFTGFRDCLFKAGFELSDENNIRISVQDITGTAQIMSEFLAAQKEPIGIFCYHDLLAAEVMRACYKKGLVIPDQVGIVGFDNLPIASSLVPTLTTVGYRVEEMADMAVQLLVERISGGASKSINYYIEPSLIIRGSTCTETQVPQDNIIKSAKELLAHTSL